MKCLLKINYSPCTLAHWQSLPIGWVKANTNAAIGTNGIIGVRLVLGDEGSYIAVVMIANLLGITTTFYGVVRAINKCLQLIRSSGYTKVIIETDSREVITSILSLCTGEFF